MNNDIFWSKIGSGFGETSGTPPPRIPRNSPGNSPLYPLLGNPFPDCMCLCSLAKVLLMNDPHGMASVDLSRDRCHIYFTFVFWSKTRKDQLIPTPKVYHDGFKGRNPWFILVFFGLSRELTKRFLTKQDEQ